MGCVDCPLSFGGSRAAGICVYLPGVFAYLPPVCPRHNLTGDRGGEVVGGMAVCVFGSLGRLGTEKRASGGKHRCDLEAGECGKEKGSKRTGKTGWHRKAVLPECCLLPWPLLVGSSDQFL